MGAVILGVVALIAIMVLIIPFAIYIADKYWQWCQRILGE
jgi:ABC-type transport system involved in cytochrome c biogenesis permease subunit